MIDRRLERHHLTPILRDRAHGMRGDRAVAHAKLWYFLCNRRMNGFRFRERKIAGPFDADFYCFQTKLILQIDAEPLTNAQAEWLDATGHRILNVTVDQVQHRLVELLEKILSACCERARTNSNEK